MAYLQSHTMPLDDVRFNPTSYPGQPGSIRHENGKTYKFVEFTGANAVVAGDIVNYVVYASDGTLTKVDKAATVHGAGVVVAAVAAGSKATGAVGYAFGWIQIKGLATVAGTVEGSPSAGDRLTSSGATAGFLTKSTAHVDQVCGQLYDATAKRIIADFPGA